MGRRLTIIVAAVAASLLLLAASLVLPGCDKERIVESTEYVHDVEYIQLPPDTVVHWDTVYRSDSVVINRVDTVNITVVVHDTVVTIRNVYDTVETVDTVLQSNPNALLAIGAMQYHTDPLVFEFISQEFGLNDGWVFYLSSFQMDVVQRSTGVYDIAGYIDYWTPDWSSYYPIEYYWRVTFTGGDPALPANWQLSEPASAAGHVPGLRQASGVTTIRQLLR